MENLKLSLEEEKGARARLRLREERLRVLLKKWDGLVKTLLREVAEVTWHDERRRRVLRRTVGQESGLFGIHWEAHLKESASHTGYTYTQRTYYRVSLVTDDDFLARQFVIECGDEKRRGNKRIEASVSAEGVKAALLEAHRAGPASHHYVFERPYF